MAEHQLFNMSACSGHSHQTSNPQNTLRLDNKTYNAPAVPGLITPPESPVEELLARTEFQLHHCPLAATSSPHMIMFNGQAFSQDQIRAMADVLTQARRNGDFPQTTASPLDSNAIVRDYEDLLRLRATYGDFTSPPPEDYRKLRVEIARRIQDRDAALDEEATREEAARRVNTYLRSVEQERQHYDQVLRDRGIIQPTQDDGDKVGDELCAMVEKSIEQSAEYFEHTMADVHGHLKNATTEFHNQNHVLGRHINDQQHALQLQSEKLAAIERLVAPQAMNMQAMSHNLAMLSNLVNQLSQALVQMPTPMNQSLESIIQSQAGSAISGFMAAHDQAMAGMMEEESEPSDDPTAEDVCIGFDIRDLPMGEHLGLSSPVPTITAPVQGRPQVIRYERVSKQGRGKIRKVIRKVLRREP